MTDSGLVRVDQDFTTEYPGADALASECFVNAVRVGEAIQAEVSRRLRNEIGLSTTALMVLATVDGLGGQATPTEIGKYVPITSAAITSLIDTNEKRGFVERSPDPHDRRKTQIRLTDEGRSVTDRILPGVHQLEADVMRVLTKSERTTLLELLDKVHRSVQAASQEPAVLVPAPRIRPDR